MSLQPVRFMTSMSGQARGWSYLLTTTSNWALLGSRPPLTRALDIRHSEWAARSDDGYKSLLPSTLTGLGGQIYVAAAKLQTFYESIVEMRHFVYTSCNGLPPLGRAYSGMATLNRDMTAWYQALPPDLHWTSDKKDVVPAGFFLLQ